MTERRDTVEPLPSLGKPKASSGAAFLYLLLTVLLPLGLVLLCTGLDLRG